MLDTTDASQLDAHQLETWARQASKTLVQVLTEPEAERAGELAKFMSDNLTRWGFDPREGRVWIALAGQEDPRNENARLRNIILPRFDLLMFFARLKHARPGPRWLAATLGVPLRKINESRRDNYAKREWIMRIAALRDFEPKKPKQ